MGIEKNPLGKPCKGCFFLGKNLGNCDYWLIMDKLRPCPPGKECTVKTTQTPKEFERVILWDTVLAKNLYNQGATDAEIAKACRASISEVKAFRRRHLGEANHKKQGYGWDKEKGLQLWLGGATDKKVAEAVGATEPAVREYRRKYWMHLEDQREQKQQSVKWDTEKGMELYRAGATDREIAEQMGVHPETIRHYRKKNWGDSNHKRKTTWDTEKGLEMYRQGKSIYAIAKELGVSKQSVQAYERRNWRGESGKDRTD